MVNAQVLRREGVRKFDCFVERIHNDNRAVLIDGLARYRGGRQSRQLAFDFLRHLRGQALRCGQENGTRVRIVLRLRQHVGSEEYRIAFRRDDQDLRRSRNEVDTDFSR